MFCDSPFEVMMKCNAPNDKLQNKSGHAEPDPEEICDAEDTAVCENRCYSHENESSVQMKSEQRQGSRCIFVFT